MISRSDDDEEEGLLHSPQRIDSTEDLRFADPKLLDYNRWKQEAGSLIRSENYVLMHNDDELRNAISKAIFLESASDNLVKKRKRQIEILEEHRIEEGITGKKILEDNSQCLQQKLGPNYFAVRTRLAATFHRATIPFEPPDIRRPPPTFVPLPPMHVPPPPVTKLPLSVANSSVTSEFSRTDINRVPVGLISQHLLPPPVDRSKTYCDEVTRSDLNKTLHEDGKKFEHAPKTVSPQALGDRNTSWRTPFHPVPVPPPSVFQFFVSTPSFNQKRFGPIALRFSSNEMRSSQLCVPRRRSNSPPGVIGVNVHGVFVGNRPLMTPPLRKSPSSSHSSDVSPKI